MERACEESGLNIVPEYEEYSLPIFAGISFPFPAFTPGHQLLKLRPGIGFYGLRGSAGVDISVWRVSGPNLPHFGTRTIPFAEARSQLVVTTTTPATAFCNQVLVDIADANVLGVYLSSHTQGRLTAANDGAAVWTITPPISFGLDEMILIEVFFLHDLTNDVGLSIEYRLDGIQVGELTSGTLAWAPQSTRMMPGDSDIDLDVDRDDDSAFRAAFSGPIGAQDYSRPSNAELDAFDSDRDLDIDCEDRRVQLQHWSFPSIPPASLFAPCDLDCNGNSVADVMDLAFFTSIDGDADGMPDECQMPVPCPGDANADRTVSFLDVASVLVNFGNVYGPPPETGDGDADLSGDVNFLDIATVLVNFGSACP